MLLNFLYMPEDLANLLSTTPVSILFLWSGAKYGYADPPTSEYFLVNDSVSHSCFVSLFYITGMIIQISDLADDLGSYI